MSNGLDVRNKFIIGLGIEDLHILDQLERSLIDIEARLNRLKSGAGQAAGQQGGQAAANSVVQQNKAKQQSTNDLAKSQKELTAAQKDQSKVTQEQVSANKQLAAAQKDRAKAEAQLAQAIKQKTAAKSKEQKDDANDAVRKARGAVGVARAKEAEASANVRVANTSKSSADKIVAQERRKRNDIRATTREIEKQQRAQERADARNAKANQPTFQGTPGVTQNFLGATRLTKNELSDVTKRVFLWSTAVSAMFGTLNKIRQAGQVSIGIEDSVAEFRKVMSEDTPFIQLRDNIIKTSVEMGGQMDQVFDLAKTWAQQGKTMVETTELTRTALLGVNAALLTEKESVEFLTSATNAYNTEASRSITLIDKLMRVQANFAITSQDIANSLRITAPLGEAVDADINELIGFTTAIKEITRQTGNTVGQSVKTILTRLYRPTTLNALNEAGIFTRDSRTGRAATPDQIFSQISNINKTPGNSELIRDLAVQIGGVRKVPETLALIQNFDEAVRAANASALAYGDAIKANEIALDTTSKKIEKMNNAWADFGNALFTQNSSSLLNQLRGMIDLFGQLAGAMKGVVESDLVAPLVNSLPTLGLLAGGKLAVGAVKKGFIGSALRDLPLEAALGTSSDLAQVFRPENLLSSGSLPPGVKEQISKDMKAYRDEQLKAIVRTVKAAPLGTQGTVQAKLLADLVDKELGETNRLLQQAGAGQRVGRGTIAKNAFFSGFGGAVPFFGGAAPGNLTTGGTLALGSIARTAGSVVGGAVLPAAALAAMFAVFDLVKGFVDEVARKKADLSKSIDSTSEASNGLRDLYAQLGATQDRFLKTGDTVQETIDRIKSSEKNKPTSFYDILKETEASTYKFADAVKALRDQYGDNPIPLSGVAIAAESSGYRLDDNQNRNKQARDILNKSIIFLQYEVLKNMDAALGKVDENVSVYREQILGANFDGTFLSNFTFQNREVGGVAKKLFESFAYDITAKQVASGAIPADRAGDFFEINKRGISSGSIATGLTSIIPKALGVSIEEALALSEDKLAGIFSELLLPTNLEELATYKNLTVDAVSGKKGDITQSVFLRGLDKAQGRSKDIIRDFFSSDALKALEALRGETINDLEGAFDLLQRTGKALVKISNPLFDLVNSLLTNLDKITNQARLSDEFGFAFNEAKERFDAYVQFIKQSGDIFPNLRQQIRSVEGQRERLTALRGAGDASAIIREIERNAKLEKDSGIDSAAITEDTFAEAEKALKDQLITLEESVRLAAGSLIADPKLLKTFNSMLKELGVSVDSQEFSRIVKGVDAGSKESMDAFVEILRLMNVGFDQARDALIKRQAELDDLNSTIRLGEIGRNAITGLLGQISGNRSAGAQSFVRSRLADEALRIERDVLERRRQLKDVSEEQHQIEIYRLDLKKKEQNAQAAITSINERLAEDILVADGVANFRKQIFGLSGVSGTAAVSGQAKLDRVALRERSALQLAALDNLSSVATLTPEQAVLVDTMREMATQSLKTSDAERVRQQVVEEMTVRMQQLTETVQAVQGVFVNVFGSMNRFRESIFGTPDQQQRLQDIQLERAALERSGQKDKDVELERLRQEERKLRKEFGADRLLVDTITSLTEIRQNNLAKQASQQLFGSEFLGYLFGGQIESLSPEVQAQIEAMSGLKGSLEANTAALIENTYFMSGGDTSAAAAAAAASLTGSSSAGRAVSGILPSSLTKRFKAVSESKGFGLYAFAGDLLGNLFGGGLSKSLGRDGSYAGSGASIGGMLGTFLSPLGAAAGSLLGGLLGGLFSPKLDKTSDILDEIAQNTRTVADNTASLKAVDSRILRAPADFLLPTLATAGGNRIDNLVINVNGGGDASTVADAVVRKIGDAFTVGNNSFDVIGGRI